MKTISREELRELYDKDFPLWAEISYELLKERAYELVDWENLLEEIQDMARSDLKACISYLAVILEHMYKWDNFRQLTKGGKEKGGLGWIKSLENSRSRLQLLLKRYPSLKEKLPAYLQDAWEEAVVNLEEWLRDANLSLERYPLPLTCPYTYEQAMTRDLRKEIKP